jgi:hypothetical protein
MMHKKIACSLVLKLFQQKLTRQSGDWSANIMRLELAEEIGRRTLLILPVTHMAILILYTLFEKIMMIGF